MAELEGYITEVTFLSPKLLVLAPKYSLTVVPPTFSLFCTPLPTQPSLPLPLRSSAVTIRVAAALRTRRLRFCNSPSSCSSRQAVSNGRRTFENRTLQCVTSSTLPSKHATRLREEMNNFGHSDVNACLPKTSLDRFTIQMILRTTWGTLRGQCLPSQNIS